MTHMAIYYILLAFIKINSLQPFRKMNIDTILKTRITYTVEIIISEEVKINAKQFVFLYK